MNWIQGSTTWRKGSYQAMRKATGMATTKAIPKPISTRDTLAHTWPARVPSMTRAVNAAQI